MQPVRYTFLYCDQCGWYFDITDAGMQARCNDCGNVSLNYLNDSKIQAIYDRLYDVQMDIGVRYCKNIFALNKDLGFWATPLELMDGMNKTLHLDDVEKEFRRRRAQDMIDMVREHLTPDPTVSGQEE